MLQPLNHAELDTAVQMCLTSDEQRARITSTSLLVMVCLMQSRMLLAFFAVMMHFSFTVSLLSTKTLMSFLAEPLSSWPAASAYWCLRLLLPWGRIWHFPLLNFMRFISDPFLQPVQVPLNGTTPLSFVSSANLLRAHSASSSRPLTKGFNSIGPTTDPWWTPLGTPLVTCFQLDFLPLIIILCACALL